MRISSMYECFDFLVLAIASLFAVSHYTALCIETMFWIATVLLNVLWICVQDLSSISYENKSALAYETLNPALL